MFFLSVRNEINVLRAGDKKIPLPLCCLKQELSGDGTGSVQSIFSSFRFIRLETAGKSEQLHNLSNDAEGKNVQ